MVTLTDSPTIAIDYTPAYEQGAGIGRLVRELIASLADIDSETAYKLFVSGTSSSDLPAPPGSNFAWYPTRLSPQWLARIWHRARMPLPVEFWMGQVDIFHATDFVLPPALPWTKTLLTVHDLSFVRVPDAASPRLYAYLSKVVPRSVRAADCVIADSEATRRDLLELYNLDTSKVEVLLSGIGDMYRPVVFDVTIRKKYSVPNKPYLFSIGTIQPRKNYSRSIQTLAHLRAKGYDIDFVIAGGRGWLEDEMYDTINRTGMSNHVHLIGFADDADLPALYSGAECTLFPSLYEGFGFPVLESMACGTPVVTSDVSSLPEVAGDAALLVDPLSVDAITHAVQRILDDSTLRQTLIERGFRQAKKFTWERSAHQLRQIYADVLSE
jgi:glycosyltransferase involved in cell wall biosynthesis